MFTRDSALVLMGRHAENEVLRLYHLLWCLSHWSALFFSAFVVKSCIKLELCLPIADVIDPPKGTLPVVFGTSIRNQTSGAFMQEQRTPKALLLHPRIENLVFGNFDQKLNQWSNHVRTVNSFFIYAVVKPISTCISLHWNQSFLQDVFVEVSRL